MADDLQINIKTTADTAGAKAAASSLQDVADSAGKGAAAAKQGATAAKDQAKGFSELGETAEKGAAAGRVLGDVMRGNIFALGQLGPVLKAVGQAFKANPLFLIGSIAATVILPVFQKISDGWEAQKEKAREAGEAAQASMEKARDAIAKKGDNAVEQQFKDIEAAAQRALRMIDAVTTATIAQTDAKEAVALAQIDANAGLSNQEKLLAKAKVQEEARTARLNAQLAALKVEEDQSQKRVKQSAGPVAQAKENEARARADVARVESRSPEVIKRDLEANFKAEKSGQLKGDKIEELFQRRADLNEELARAEKTYADTLQKAQQRLEAAIQKRIDAEETAATLAQAASDEVTINNQKRIALKAQNEAANTVSKIQTGTLGAQAAGPVTPSRPTSGGRIIGPDGVVKDFAGKSQEAIDRAAAAVRDLSSPDPLNTDALRENLIVYNGQVIRTVASQQARINDLAATVRSLGAQLEIMKQNR